MYCKFLKLTSGENLIVSTEDECVELVDKKYIEVSEPVEIHAMKMPYAGGVIESYIMQPWLKMSAKEVLRIPAHNILVATNVMEKAESQYKQFILEYDQMALATDEDIEKALTSDEDLTEDEIEEEDYDSWTDSGDRTYH
ncbi:hypothetical protein UFOVP242_156 [uncultured Caudovirales phage]|uniref:Uncharacterized protein n=1 Tax=uncultured Caudovirales phage TaxID=2100421 RepID=A0A6J7WZ05_9CAUD|nr:hypothetical protein UFOVP242_156 [uncultured Caudovirales phage]